MDTSFSFFPPKCRNWRGGWSLQVLTSLQGQQSRPGGRRRRAAPRSKQSAGPEFRGSASTDRQPARGLGFHACRTVARPGSHDALGGANKEPPSWVWTCFSDYRSRLKRNKAPRALSP